MQGTSIILCDKLMLCPQSPRPRESDHEHKSRALGSFFRQWFPTLWCGDCGDRSRARCQGSAGAAPARISTLYITLYITLFPAIVFSALFCGVGPAALAIVLGLLGARVWFLTPVQSLSVPDAPQL